MQAQFSPSTFFLALRPIPTCVQQSCHYDAVLTLTRNSIIMWRLTLLDSRHSFPNEFLASQSLRNCAIITAISTEYSLTETLSRFATVKRTTEKSRRSLFSDRITFRVLYLLSFQPLTTSFGTFFYNLSLSNLIQFCLSLVYFWSLSGPMLINFWSNFAPFSTVYHFILNVFTTFFTVYEYFDSVTKRHRNRFAFITFPTRTNGNGEVRKSM